MKDVIRKQCIVKKYYHSMQLYILLCARIEFDFDDVVIVYANLSLRYKTGDDSP